MHQLKRLGFGVMLMAATLACSLVGAASTQTLPEAVIVTATPTQATQAEQAQTENDTTDAAAPQSVAQNVVGSGGAGGPQDGAGGCATSYQWTNYIVSSGDTLGVIAGRYGVGVQTLVDGNCLANADSIYAGQSLRVPVSGNFVQAPPSSSASPTPLPPGFQSGGLRTFTDSYGGFAFDYPAGWSVLPGGSPTATVWATTIASYNIQNAPGRGGTPPGTKIDIYTSQSVGTVTLEGMVAQTASESQLIEQRSVQLTSGLPGVRLRILDRTGVEVQVLHTVINGRPVTAAGYGSSAEFDNVAYSLRPS